MLIRREGAYCKQLALTWGLVRGGGLNRGLTMGLFHIDVRVNFHRIAVQIKSFLFQNLPVGQSIDSKEQCPFPI